ncbi:MAG: alpha-L-fucosidase [Planctomycetota bacterium]
MRVFSVAALAVTCVGSVFAAPTTLPPERTPEEQAAHDAKMAWWRDARFGMFIHWGVYAVPAGTYEGKEVPGIGEWIMKRAEIPVAEYKQYAKDFTAENYDPEAWAALAKQAGMKYVIITSKHHDGFALFDSDVTDWDAADASPAGRDLIGPLVDAVRGEGLKMGLYYSHDQDWTHRGGSKRQMPEGGGWDEAHKGSFDDYLEQIAVPQAREILTRYPIDVLWWDTPTLMTVERARPFVDMLKIRPDLITNNRLIFHVPELAGDTETPEQTIPATGFPGGRDFEVCMTMNDTWGYKSYDDNWKPTGDLIRKLCDIASKGGNFLLNVGPKADGTIPPESVTRLREIGAWMDVNGEAIYGTSPSPFRKVSWGRCTRKDVGGGVTRLYLHVFDPPADGRLVVPVMNEVVSATSLADGKPLPTVERTDGGLVLDISDVESFDPVCTVFAVDVAGPAEAVDTRLQLVDSKIVGLPEVADLHNHGYSQGQLRVEVRDGVKTLVNWKDRRSYASWPVNIETPGRYAIEFDVSATAFSELNVSVGNGATQVKVEPTGGSFARQRLGTVKITAPTDEMEIALKPIARKWRPIELKSVTLVRVD